jgi:hypothetical protein
MISAHLKQRPTTAKSNKMRRNIDLNLKAADDGLRFELDVVELAEVVVQNFAD